MWGIVRGLENIEVNICCRVPEWRSEEIDLRI